MHEAKAAGVPALHCVQTFCRAAVQTSGLCCLFNAKWPIDPSLAVRPPVIKLLCSGLARAQLFWTIAQSFHKACLNPLNPCSSAMYLYLSLTSSPLRASRALFTAVVPPIALAGAHARACETRVHLDPQNRWWACTAHNAPSTVARARWCAHSSILSRAWPPHEQRAMTIAPSPGSQEYGWRSPLVSRASRPSWVEAMDATVSANHAQAGETVAVAWLRRWI